MCSQSHPNSKTLKNLKSAQDKTKQRVKNVAMKKCSYKAEEVSSRFRKTHVH